MLTLRTVSSVKTPPTTNLTADQVGALLVTMLSSGMVLAPVVWWVLGDAIATPALLVRGVVAVLAVLLAWLPLPVPAAWRRMLAVSLLAAHHVGVGVAVGLPMSLLVELLVGAVFIGGLACWLLPRSGFGALLGITLALGTIGLGLLPPAAEPAMLAVWASVFIVGGLAAEFSVWVGPRVPPPGAPTEEVAAPPDRRAVEGAALTVAEDAGLGVATIRSSRNALSGASRALIEMTSEWPSPTAWWQQLVDRDRVPAPGRKPVSVEMFTPGMRNRKAFRLWAVQHGSHQRVFVQDTSELIDVRREAERLVRSLEAARGEAEAAREARAEAFRSRSHHLRTPLSNLMASLELASMSVEEGASLGIIGEDLESARGSAEELHTQLNRLVDEIVSDSHDRAAEHPLDLVALVDRELDGLQNARSLRRSYAEAVLPVRGARDELTSLVQTTIRRAVAACRNPVMVRVERTPTHEACVGFRVAPADVQLIRTAIRDLAPRAAALGGRLSLSEPDGPALFLPDGSRNRRGVEAEVTWPGAIPRADASDEPRLFADVADLSDDDPTHIAYSRRQAIEAPDKPADDRRRFR